MNPFDRPFRTPLNAVRAFESAARLRSFTRAAQELGVTQGAVSRQVATLEGHLGRKLFRRAGRGIEITHIGQIYAAETRDALARIKASGARLLRRPDDTVLTVGATSVASSPGWRNSSAPTGRFRCILGYWTRSSICPDRAPISR